MGDITSSATPQPAELRATPYARIAPLLLAAALGVAAAYPVLGAALPTSDDSMYHLLRSVQVGELLRNGILFSRWAPDMVWGYGYPLFNYYPPLAYYLIHLVSIVCADPVAAANLSLVVISAIASLSMYLWGAELFGARGGLVSAAAYVFSPYLIANTFCRYAIAEQLALALLPLAIYCLARLSRTRRSLFGVCGALVYAAMILAHSATALLATPFVAAYVLYLACGARDGRPCWRALVPYGLCIALGLALSAWHWLPALAESNLVQLERLTLWEMFDYRRHLIPASQLFTLPEWISPRLLNQDLAFPRASLVLLMLLAGVSALGLPSRSTDRKLWLLLLGAALLPLLLAVDLSAPIWERIEPMRMLQFPWRFLGLAMLPLAALAGASVPVLDRWLARLPGQAWTRALLPGLLIACLVGHTAPWQRTLYRHTDLGPATIGAVRTHGACVCDIGTTTTGEYLPVTIKELPEPRVVSEERAARVERASLPAGAALSEVRYSALRETVTVETETAFDLVFNTFYFPGWRAELDGESVPIQPTKPHGLISVAVPPGMHTISLAFGSTPVRRVAKAVSLAGLGLAIVWLCVAVRQRGQAAPESLSPVNNDLTLRQMLLIALLGAAALALARLPGRIPNSHQLAQSLAYAGATFWGNLTLLGAEDLPSLTTGETGAVTLYWQLVAPADERYSTSVQLLDPTGHIIAQSDNQHPGGVPTDEWLPQPCYTRDRHVLRIPYGTPPGAYALQLVAYRYGEPEAVLDARRANGSPLDAPLLLGYLQVRAGGPLPLDRALGATFEEQVTLLGLEWPDAARSGEEAIIWLYWQAGPLLANDLSASLRVLDGSGRTVAQEDHVDIAGYPATRWLAGRVYEEAFQVALPPGLPPGVYHLHLLVYRRGEPAATLGDTLSLGELAVIRPVRPVQVADLPLLERIEQPVRPGLVLLGVAELPQEAQAGQGLDLALYWQAQANLQSDFDITIRMLDAAGGVIWERRAPPAPGWPTRSWRRKEIWRGLHTIAIPAHLESGLYRLELQGEAGAAPIPVGELWIQAPERRYQAPPYQYAADETFGGLATLVGYTLQGTARPGGALEVRLVWQAQEVTPASYKGFVHLVDGQGQWVAGSDAVPAGWLRPTTGWAPGEFIEDTHRLALPETLPPGEYGLIVGMYEETTLRRLATGQGQDALRLTPVQIEEQE
jgi:hypothetical protein